MEINKIYQGDVLDVLKTFPDESIDCCITSPPYWGLRDYGVDGQLGLEKTPEEYVANMVKLFGEVKRVLKNDGTLWLNLGDSYFAKPKSNYDGKAAGLQSKNYGTGDTELGYKKQADRFKNLLASGYKNKDLVGIPWRVAFALQADGWYLRQDIIWAKPNPMPESVQDRCTKSHEYIFLLSKSPKYYFDNEAIREPSSGSGSNERTLRELQRQKKNRAKGNVGLRKDPMGYSVTNSYKSTKEPEEMLDGRNKRSVWTITTKPFSEAHFATFPENLVAPMIKAGCPENGIVLDPFMGAGTTGVVAKKLNRSYIGIELNPAYIAIAEKRLRAVNPLL